MEPFSIYGATQILLSSRCIWRENKPSHYHELYKRLCIIPLLQMFNSIQQYAAVLAPFKTVYWCISEHYTFTKHTITASRNCSCDLYSGSLHPSMNTYNELVSPFLILLLTLFLYFLAVILPPQIRMFQRFRIIAVYSTICRSQHHLPATSKVVAYSTI